MLAKYLLERACRKLGRTPATFSPEALAALTSHPWPGNVRELENAIERAVILADGPVVTPDLLALEMPGGRGARAPARASPRRRAPAHRTRWRSTSAASSRNGEMVSNTS